MTAITPSHGRADARERFDEIDPAVPVGYWVERFGADPQDFNDYSFFQRNPRLIWIARRGLEIPACLDLEAIGMGFLRTGMPYPKPTSHAAIIFGGLARKNVVHLDDEDARRFLSRERFPYPEDEIDSPGFVLARNRGLQLGCGLWLEGHLSSLVPRRWDLKVL